ncbi:glycoside hydrolase family 73 protein [Secundilactobacillus kimchicus]|uniref:glycoside hydrolase family 73 protein n=1 Tax=Secundilactobacillus kimchicus TaxID=528209 RepID=UPI0006CF74AC|nr:glycoside hydrolase family 73 protein [Secundilactobacillus kimchicus]
MHKQTVVKMVSACFVTLGLAVGITTSQPQHSKASTQTTQFISKLGPSVKSVANSYKLYPSVMMAQAALESGWGSSTLSTSANNYFGVKGAYNGQSVTMSTAEYDSNGQLYYTDAQFKKYPSIKASMTDNAQLLRNGISGNPSFYSGTWRENASTYEDAANALTGKYATAPNYGQSLINLIQTYSLDALDSGGSTGAAQLMRIKLPTIVLLVTKRQRLAVRSENMPFIIMSPGVVIKQPNTLGKHLAVGPAGQFGWTIEHISHGRKRTGTEFGLASRRLPRSIGFMRKC